MPPKVKQMILEQEEQKIYEQIKELGYRIKEGLLESDRYILGIYKGIGEGSLTLIIWKDRTYSCTDNSITLKLHQLLHRLFKVWGWFDE